MGKELINQNMLNDPTRLAAALIQKSKLLLCQIMKMHKSLDTDFLKVLFTIDESQHLC